MPTTRTNHVHNCGPETVMSETLDTSFLDSAVCDKISLCGWPNDYRLIASHSIVILSSLWYLKAIEKLRPWAQGRICRYLWAGRPLKGDNR